MREVGEGGGFWKPVSSRVSLFNGDTTAQVSGWGTEGVTAAHFQGWKGKSAWSGYCKGKLTGVVLNKVGLNKWCTSHIRISVGSACGENWTELKATYGVCQNSYQKLERLISHPKIFLIHIFDIFLFSKCNNDQLCNFPLWLIFWMSRDVMVPTAREMFHLILGTFNQSE